jgi:hypothetical protein
MSTNLMRVEVKPPPDSAAARWLRFIFSVGSRRPKIEALDNSSSQDDYNIECPDDLSSLWVSMLEADTSPMTGMKEAFPHSLPKFDCLFLASFKDYLDKGLPDALPILESLVRSQQSNALRLAQLGAMSVLYPAVPWSLDLLEVFVSQCDPAACYFVTQGGLFLLGKFADVPYFQLTISSIFRIVAKIPIDFEVPLLPPQECDFADDLEYPEVLDSLLQSDDPAVVLNMLCALHDWFLTSTATSVIVGRFLRRFWDFLDHDSLKVPALKALGCFRGKIPDVIRLVSDLVPQLFDTDETAVTALLVFYEECVKRYGINLFSPRVLRAVLAVAEAGTYRVKIASVWFIAKLVRRGTSTLHEFLVESGVVGRLCELFDFFIGQVATDMLTIKMLKSLITLLESPGVQVDEEIAGQLAEIGGKLGELEKHPDYGLARLAPQADEMIGARMAAAPA